MQEFSLRTAIGGIALFTILGASLVKGNFTSLANRSIGQAEITVQSGDNNSLNASVQQFAGWKIFQYKIWEGAGKVVLAAASAAATYLAVDAINGPSKNSVIAQLSEPENVVRQSILIEELN